MTTSDDQDRRSEPRPGPRRVSGGGDEAAGGLADSGTAGGIGRSEALADRVVDPLGEALRALPAETAGPGFTARVLARLDESERASSGSPALRPAAAWAMLAVAGLVAAVGVAVTRSGGPPAEEPARIAELTAADRSGEGAAEVPEGRAAAVPGSPETSQPPSPRSARVRPGPEAGRSPGSAPDGAAADEAAPASPGPAVGALRVAAGDAEAARSAGDARLAGSASASPGPPSDARASLDRLRAELDALRRDHRRLEIGLSDLPELGRDGQPVIYVGGDEGLELVLDLGRDPGPRSDPRGDRPAGTSL